MPQERPLPAGSVGGRWVVAQRDISEHIVGSPPAHLALVYDPGADLILAFGVDATVDEAVASAFEQIQNPASAGPATLACDPGVMSAVRLESARFDPPPTVAAALNAELRVVKALFDNFLTSGPPGRAHFQAVTSLEAPARHFLASTCWMDRADSQPLLLDASIDGVRMGGIVSVLGNGGEAYGVCIFPDGAAFDAVIDSGDQPGMPPDGVLNCVIDRRAVRKKNVPAVEMAARIGNGEAEPARGRDLQLLHVALMAAALAPPVGEADPVSGTVSEPDFEAAFVVFDLEGAQRQLRSKRQAKRYTRKANRPRVSPSVRFGELPREAAVALVPADDELASSLLETLPSEAGLPTVFVRYDTAGEAKSTVRAVEAGHYLGVAMQATPIGTVLRLIGRDAPILLGAVGTNWPQLRGFMRRRERCGGLHALVVASAETDDLHGIFVCVLPQPAVELHGTKRSTLAPRSRPSKAGLSARQPRRPQR